MFVILTFEELDLLSALSRAHSPAVCAVYLALKRHAGKSMECFPSLERLAEKAGVGRATVARALRALEDAGLIECRKRGRVNLYRLNSVLVPSQNETQESQNDTGPVSKRDGTRLKMRRELYSSNYIHLTRSREKEYSRLNVIRMDEYRPPKVM